MLQIGCLCLFFAATWLGTCVWWRWDAAAKQSEHEEALAAAEQDRNDAISKAISAEKARDDFQRQLRVAAQIRTEAVERADKLKADNQLLGKSNSDLSIENAGLTVQSDKLQSRLAAVLGRLHENLHTRRPANWKSVVVQILREHGNG